jgi:DNA-directed RNA polymerase specialized sigma24 family protein
LNCTECQSYNRGFGSPACLKCGKYKDVCKQSGKRKTLPIETVPQAILEEIEDDRPQISSLIDAIRALPSDHAAIISMVFLGGLSVKETAQILKVSRQAVDKKIKFSIEIIRESLK